MEVEIADDAVTARFTEVDLQLFRNTLADALETDMDGNSRRWVNPNTGNFGRIKIIRTLGSKESRCRQVRVSNTLKHRNTKASNVFTYCRGDDANWSVQGGSQSPPVDDH